jgi:hypothetical protein
VITIGSSVTASPTGAVSRHLKCYRATYRRAIHDIGMSWGADRRSAPD